MKEINRDTLNAILIGSQFLTSGADVKTTTLSHIINECCNDDFSVPLIDIENLSDDELSAAVGIIGPPTVLENNNPFFMKGESIIRQLENLKQEKINSLFSIEAASINLVYPLIIAAMNNLPLIDGDIMGRAFPELQMTTFQFNNIPITPFIAVDLKNNVYQYDCEDAHIIDTNIRHKVINTGGIAFFIGFPAKANILKNFIIPKTFSLAIEIGQSFLCSYNYNQLIESLNTVTQNSIYGCTIELIIGIVEKIDAYDQSNIGSFSIKGLHNYRHKEMRLYYRYENLVAYIDNQLVACVPDLITIIDLNQLRPISIAELQVNTKIAVIGLPSPLQLRTDKALSIIGPKSFGFKNNYRALEQLHYDYYY